jgi:hypothetical protein
MVMPLSNLFTALAFGFVAVSSAWVGDAVNAAILAFGAGFEAALFMAEVRRWITSRAGGRS